MVSTIIFIIALVIGFYFALCAIWFVLCFISMLLLFLYSLPFTAWAVWTEQFEKYPFLNSNKMFVTAKYATKFYKHIFFHKELDF